MAQRESFFSAIDLIWQSNSKNSWQSTISFNPNQFCNSERRIKIFRTKSARSGEKRGGGRASQQCVSQSSYLRLLVLGARGSATRGSSVLGSQRNAGPILDIFKKEHHRNENPFENKNGKEHLLQKRHHFL
jgi:hypothetical protein